MTMTDAVGPTVGTGWTPHDTLDEDGRTLEILVAAGTAGGEEQGRAILARPRARRLGSGERMLSITLILRRAPRVGEAVEPLLDRALVVLDVETLPSPDVLSGGVTPLVPRSTALTLVDTTGGRDLATARIDGPGRAGAMQATLEGEGALAVLAAVQGRSSNLACRAALTYRDAATTGDRVHVAFDLATVHDRLSAVADESRRFAVADLRHYLGRWVGEGLVNASPAGAGEAALLRAFLRAAAPVLDPVPDVADPALGAVYTLGARPPGRMSVQATAAPAAASDAVVTIAAGLDDLVDDATRGGTLEAHVHLLAPGSDGLEPIPAPSPRRRTAVASTKALVARNGQVTTQWAAVRGLPDAFAAPHAHTILAADPVAYLPGRPDRFALPDERIPADGEPETDGPVTDDPDAPLWADRRDAGRLWYAPVYDLVMPDAAVATAAATPFRFRFRTVGHDAQGRLTVEATVRLTLRAGMSDATIAAWEARGRPALERVPGQGLSAELRIPYRDEDSVLRTQAIPAARTVDEGDEVAVEFDLGDRWARVAYGALSRPGFQTSAARVSVAYTFTGWERAYIPILLGAAVLRAAALDATRGGPADGAGRIAYPGGILELRATPLTAARPRMRPQNDPWEPPDTVGDPVEPAPAPPPPVVVLPPLPPVVVPPPIVIDPVVRYWARTQGRVAALDVLVPCAEFGALYVEDVNGLDRPIGCQEAYQLGQAPRRVYEEVPVTAATGGTRVLRALTTPGRFVLVPGSFRIGRYEPGDGDRGYRPSMMLLSTIDVDHLANSKCVFAAGLLADVSPADRAAIERELRAKHHPAPVLTDVTELPAAVTITWALPRSSNGWTVTDESTRSVRGFQVVLTTDTAGVLALQRLLATAGIHGSAAFELDDGLRLSSALALELDHIVGPESTGPLSVEMTGGVATLRNHVESPVAVSDVLADTGADLVPVAVDAVIAVGASVDVDVPNGTDRVLPVAFVQSTPGSLQEVRAYVEDITFELRFLDLARTADNAIATLDVTARMADDPHEEHVRLDAGAPSGTVEFVTPLTRFAATRRLEIRVDQVAPDGAVTRGAPFPWDLDTQGNFVSLTPELVLGASSTP